MDTTIFEPLDAYCERLGPGLWAEPVNALTNLAFVVAALAAAMRMDRPAPPFGIPLVAILALVGIGSTLFHTFANVVTAFLDVGAIAAFVFVYIFAVNRHVLRWPHFFAWAGLAAFVPFAALTGSIFSLLPFFSTSAGYWPIALLIAIYGVALRRRIPDFARGLLIGAGILSVSLVARSADLALCDDIPLGTHFLWHILNGALLFWMIDIYRRFHAVERLAAARPQG